MNVIENMTTTVGTNKSNTVGMNSDESIGMKLNQSIGMIATQSLGAMKMTSVIGDASMFITGKLTEMIEGDVHSETKKERTETSEGKIITQSTGNNEQHSKKIVKNNRSEKSSNSKSTF